MYGMIHYIIDFGGEKALEKSHCVDIGTLISELSLEGK